MKVDERVNIWMSLLNGSLLKIFPLQGSVNNKWLNLADSMAYVPLSGKFEVMCKDLQLISPNYSNILRAYLLTVFEATKSGDYSLANKILGIIENLQRQGTPESLLPTSSMVNLEIRYNESQIFILLRNCYGFLSLILLLLAFIDNLRIKRSRIILYLLYFFIGLLGVAFLFHTYGLTMRWYLSGHAPWSNGYEALLLIAWASLLAGFSFIRYSKITVASTALLAFSILMTASHSSYDPQLTNLQPVLKSYWLVIHVAVITISYGFLALGFILGLINIFLFLFKSKANGQQSEMLIEELTHTNEISLSVGLFLATLGTFLGGVWANESWGRYWGWDAKETWALVIVITYAIILHLRLVPKLKSAVLFNAASVIGFGSVIMTFVGVNYYLSKGLHSYAADDKTVFPFWGWLIISSLVILILLAGIKEKWQGK
jgi:cytochrome c-type biogenesis protein CcsB